MTREEHNLRAQLARLLKVFLVAEPGVQRGIISQVNDLYYDLNSFTRQPYEVHYTVLRGGEIFDHSLQKIVDITGIDPETILPKEY